MKKTALITALLLTFVASAVWAHGTGQHVLGIVTAVHADRLEVQTPQGQSVSVEVNDRTRYRPKGPLARSSPQVGDRVVIDTAKHGDALIATEVQFANGKKPASTS